jgi:hypothetical protein
MRNRTIILVSLVLAIVIRTTDAAPWRFAVVGDTHVGSSDTVKEMIPFMAADSIKFVLVCGDLVEAGLKCTAAQLRQQLTAWQGIFAPLYDNGVGVYPVRGNHEDDAADDIAVWNEIFNGAKALPQNGPTGELNLTYSFQYKNALCIGLDDYVSIHHVNQSWLNQQLAANTLPHVFVFGHEAAFKVFHTDCLDDDSVSRNTFWQSLTNARSKVYFCGHDHFFDMARIEDNDGDTSDDLYQCLSGGGGGWRMTKFNYNGSNTPYKPVGLFHTVEHGYNLVEISGDGTNDRKVTISWKQRTLKGTPQTVTYEATSDVFTYTAQGGNTAVGAKTLGIGQPAASICFVNNQVSYTINRSGAVRVDLMGIDGRHVATLNDQYHTVGTYTCCLPTSLSTGMYVGRLANDGITIQSVLVSAINHRWNRLAVAGVNMGSINR